MADARNTTTRNLLLFLTVLLFFFVSGACGLLYQVVWTRKLVLLFGTTSYAVSTVLSIFFLGLGLGSLWGGRLADRKHRPLFIYGVLEIIVGIWALLFILVIDSGEGVVVSLLRTFDFSRGVGIGLRALLAAGFLLVPVLLMGATLPLLAKYVNRESHVRGLRIGALYTLNTLGAVAGCFVTGFFLIQYFGYTRTTLIGAAANVAVGILAILVARVEEKESGADRTDRTDSTDHAATIPAPLPGRAVYAVLGAFALTGFSALAMEVLWTRLLSIVFLGTTYAYTTMLTALLCGIAAGSGAASLFVDRFRRPMFLLGIVIMLCGAGCLWSATWIAGLPERVIDLHASTGDWSATVRGKFFLAFGALFIPTFLSGMAFPLVVKTIGRGRADLGVDVGRLYSANTFGGVLGAVAGGFLIIPMLGTHNGIVFLSALLVAGGALVLVMTPRESVQPARVAAALAAGLLIFALVWWRGPDDVNAALNAGYVPKAHEVLETREGVEGTVVVTAPKGRDDSADRVLWINRVQATTSIEKGVKMNRFQGVLPLLFDRQPKDVLFMCFGSGITCGTLALSDFNRIDAVEISPDVLAVAHHFADDNLGVIEKDNVTFNIDDGRNFLLTTENAYDLITFEPMPLALAGVSTFYTKDYYDLCRERLTDTGVVSQWVPLHALNPDIVRSLVRTFITAFPEYCAWYVNADLFLIGSKAPLRIDYAGAKARIDNPELQDALARVGLPDLPGLMANFLLDKEGLDAYAAEGRIMTDDRPWAEFEAPKLVNERHVAEALEEILPHVASPMTILDPATITDAERAALEKRHASRMQGLQGVKQYYGGIAFDRNMHVPFVKALAIDPDNANAKYYLRQIVSKQGPLLVRWEEWDAVRTLVDAAAPYIGNDPVVKELRAALGEG